MDHPFTTVIINGVSCLRCTRCGGQAGSEPTTDPWVLRRLTCLLCGQSFDQPAEASHHYLEDFEELRRDLRTEQRGRPPKLATATGVS